MLRSHRSAGIVSTDKCVISFKKSPETHEVTAPRGSGPLISKPLLNKQVQSHPGLSDTTHLHLSCTELNF